MKRILACLLVVFCAVEILPAAQTTSITDAVADAAGIKGGVCVLIHPKDIQTLSMIGGQRRFVVQVLLPGRDDVVRAREQLVKENLHGNVSVIQWDGGKLPYADRLVTLLIDFRKSDAISSEAARVTSPGGAVAVTSSASAGQEFIPLALSAEKLNASWRVYKKKRPGSIDDWTHYCHGPDGNPVAQDTTVGPPQRYQWIAGPRWLQAHDTDSSVSCLVGSGRRLFYFVNDAPISATGQHALPDKWFLAARDAFNGILLWKIPVKQWGWREWKESWFKSRAGVFPLNLHRRVVGAGERLFVTLGYHAPVSEVNAATGEISKTFKGTENTNEILHLDGKLLLSVLSGKGARVKRVDLQTGNIEWETTSVYRGTTRDYIKFTAMRGKVKPAKLDPALNLATDGKVVCLLDYQHLVGLDYVSGKEIWRIKVADSGGPVWLGALILADNTAICSTDRTLYAVNSVSGKLRWKHRKTPLGHLWYEWKDVFVINNLVWTYSHKIKSQGGKYRSRWPEGFVGYDVKSGAVKKTVPSGNIYISHHHHRCYRNKATVNYILTSRRGTEFVDIRHGKHSVHNWLRGTCHYGMMPANGLQYAPPHPCQCYSQEKLKGFNAISSRPVNLQSAMGNTQILFKGEAFGTRIEETVDENDWPVFRHDDMRSGASFCPVSDTLSKAWTYRVDQQLSSPVIAEKKIYFADINGYRVIALSTKDGKKKWDHMTSARVDSPPSYHKGVLYFGCANGTVSAVRASDGVLVWHFKAAPGWCQIGSYNRLESAWPVHGSVLVRNGTVYFAAGRSSYLDGGIYLYALDAKTGAITNKHVLKDFKTTFGKTTHFKYKTDAPGALADILQADEEHIYMRNKVFTPALKPVTVKNAGGKRIQPVGGFLDNSFFRRAFWRYGRAVGELISHDNKTAYVFRVYGKKTQLLNPDTYFTPGSNECELLTQSGMGKASISIGKSKSLNPGSKAITIDAWVNAVSSNGVILAHGGAFRGYSLFLKNGRPCFSFILKNKIHTISASTSIMDKWTHVAGVLTTDKKIQIFINGKPDGSKEVPSLLPGAPGQGMEIGVDLGTSAGAYKSPYYFGGSLDEVRVTYRQVTPDELKKRVSEPGTYPESDRELALFLSFDDGEAADRSGKKNHGTITGAQPVEGRFGKAMFFDNSTWKKDIPIRVRAMVAARDKLLVAGPPDTMDMKDPFGAFEGRKGGLFWIYDKKTGNILAKYTLTSPPIFNGMAIARGKVYIISRDGTVVCFHAEK